MCKANIHTKQNSSNITCLIFFSAIALSKLLLHTIQSNDTRLQEITVQGDQIAQEKDEIRTRSKTKNSK